MSDDKIEMEPLEIKLTQHQLETIVKAGVDRVMGFKLCQLYNRYDIDEGEMKVSMRVCGGPLCIPCQCEMAQSAKKEDKFETPLLNDDLYREDDF